MRYEYKLAIRMALALILVLIPFNIFQIIFEKLLFEVVLLFLQFANVSPVVGSYSVRNAIEIFGGQYTLRIVSYCVTASAYYTMALLIMLTKGISFFKSILLFLLGSFLIFIMNFIRIVILIFVLIRGAEIFEALHLVLWLFLSIVYVGLIWIAFTKLFKIKNVPVYSDFKVLYKRLPENKKRWHKKKKK